jgi:hypothetical protein
LNDYESAVQLNPKLQEAMDGAKRVHQLLATSSRSLQTVNAGQMPSSAASPPKIAGADLFIDLVQYIGRPVIIADGGVFEANNDGALIKAGGNTFKLTVDGIDRETFRFFLKNCTGTAIGEQCTTPLLVTPTGEKSLGWPLLKNVKMIQ